MQPSNSAGRKLRFLLLPISWIVAFVVVYGIFALIAAVSSTTVRGLLQTASFWPLVVFLPAFFFGKILGLMTLNLVAFSIPAARRIFDSEVAETGRHMFSKAMKDLARFALVTGLITALAAILFFWNR